MSKLRVGAKKRLPNIGPSSKITDRYARVIAVFAVAMIGTVLVFITHAATSVVSTQPGNGIRSANATLATDTTASGGKGVKFTGTAGGLTFPLKMGPTNHYLVDQNGSPFLLNVDTAWTWLTNIPDRTEADAYLDARKAQGYNSIISFMVSFNGVNYTKNGQTPFTNGDISQPNDAYFATIDQLVTDAASRSMVIMMCPFSLSNARHNDPSPTSIQLPSVAQWQAYGTYLGARYKNFNNIIWCVGGDHDVTQTWDYDAGFDYTPYMDGLANAIKAQDSRHLMTYHPALDTYVLGSKSWLDFYSFQENRADSAPWSYDRVKGYYTYSPTKPVMDLEPGYETGDALTGVATSPFMVRRNAWWALLGGAMGMTYGGNIATWYIDSSGPNSWQNYVNLGGAKQQGYIKNIMEKYPWYKLVPDMNHVAVTAGYGSYNSSNYATAGLASDGSLLVTYTPGVATLSVNMATLSGIAKAYWYDASTGIGTPAGTNLTNSGIRTFSTPGNNAAGDADYALVITTGTAGP